MLKILLPALILSITIIYAPSYFFSAERFSRYFTGYGGIIHEALVAFIISTIFLISYLLKRISIKRITQISIAASFFVAIINSSIAVIENNYPIFKLIWENLLLSIYIFFFGIAYYSLILLLPTLVTAKIIALVIQLKTGNRDRIN